MASLPARTTFRRFAQPVTSSFHRQRVPSCLQCRAHATHQEAIYPKVPYEKAESVGFKRFSQFDLEGKVFIVTGAGRGLGLSMAEGLAEAGGKVHCLDVADSPPDTFEEARARSEARSGGSLDYHQINVTDDDSLEECVAGIAAQKQRLDGLIAAAAKQDVRGALDLKRDEIARLTDVNYTGVLLSARACARQMLKYDTPGSICLIASMSGTIANRGFHAPAYNASKGAVIQLARSLAMEWGRAGIRVNSLSPGHIVTPMVEENFRNGEADRAEWENNSMLGRLSAPEEYKAAGLFMLSKASSYMTGHDMKMDGGTTAW